MACTLIGIPMENHCHSITQLYVISSHGPSYDHSITSSNFDRELKSGTILEFDQKLIFETTVSPIYNSMKTMVEPLVSLLFRRCSTSLMATTFRFVLA